jgi:hypothetical protein
MAEKGIAALEHWLKAHGGGLGVRCRQYFIRAWRIGIPLDVTTE